jgi:Ca2+-transporting ATPase
VRIVKAFKKLKLIVAMTGDWVNDAPSIKTADIGLWMWITWTDVSKWAADIILADDNFATIVSAVEEWRRAYSNIQKAVQYLLSANIAEVLCLFIITVFLQIQFLTAIMILWINLVTDSLPALALWTEKAEKDVMNNPPRKSASSLFSGRTGKDIIIQWIMQTILTLSSFYVWHYVFGNEAWAITMAFITLSLIQLFHSYNLRSQKNSLLISNPFSNKFLNLSFIIWTILILIVVLVPQIQVFFDVTPLNYKEYLIAVSCAFFIIPFVEMQKIIERNIIK